nr:hypothetical protein [Tanacetum cinerariifolium]
DGALRRPLICGGAQRKAALSAGLACAASTWRASQGGDPVAQAGRRPRVYQSNRSRQVSAGGGAGASVGACPPSQGAVLPLFVESARAPQR